MPLAWPYIRMSYFLVSDLEDILGRRLHAWEFDYLYIMRITHSDNWTGAPMDNKYEPNGRVKVGKYGCAGVEWSVVHEDNLFMSPGVYKVDSDKGKRLFVNFVGRFRYEFPLLSEEEGNGILQEVFKGNNFLTAIEIVSHVSMNDLDDRMWKELKLE
jgi:hypothetical protein